MDRWVVLIVTIVLVVGVVGSSAQAKYGGGTGEPSDPYLIYTAEQMNAIGANPGDWDKHFMLMADIDLSTYTGSIFNIIGTDRDHPFTGVFDGNGHRISNFSCTYTDKDYVGLFGYMSGRGAEIRNLGLVDPNVNAGEGYYVGSLVGQLGVYAVISACFTRGGSVSGGSTVGGLVGKNSLGNIYHCYCTTTVVGNSFLGGLVGHAWYGLVYKCYSTGSVSGTSSYIGGLVGRSDFEAPTCFWDTETSGQTYSAGGTGKTTAEMQDPNTFMEAGWDFINAPDGPHDIWAEPVGGGYPVLWWEVPPQFGLPSFSGGTGQADDPYLISTATELNRIGHNPRLMQCHFKLIDNIDLAGVDFYIIGGNEFHSENNSYELYPFAGVFDGGYSDISNFTYTSEDRKNVGLFGCIDGMNAQVKNLGLNDPMVVAGDYIHAGTLAGHLKRGTISNSFVWNGSVSGSSFIGGLVGYNENGGEISYCDTYASVSGSSSIGGLVGRNYGTVTFSSSLFSNIDTILYGGGLVGDNAGTISNCWSFASVAYGKFLGGLVGSNSSIISYCGSEGNVFSRAINDYIDVGGFAGYNSGTISNSYSSASVESLETARRVGGLLGVNTGQVTNCYSLGSVEADLYLGGLIGFNTGPVSNCYSAGTVTALTGNDAGGLLGYNNGMITASFWDVDTSTQTQMCGIQDTSGTGCDAGNGKTTIQMQTASTFTSVGWDFVGEIINGTEDIWRLSVDGTSYPQLNWQFPCTLTISSTSGGTVTEPGEGSFPYDHGTVVPIIAQAEANYHFVQWTGTAVDAGKVADPNAGSTTVTMDGDYTLLANFVIQRTLTISLTSGGTVTEPGEGSFPYDHGTVVPIIAQAEANYHFVQWTGTAVDAGKVADPNAGSTTVTMDGDYTLLANFARNIIYVDADAIGANDGSSWADAYNYLQDALASAASGCKIWVAEGTYKPDEDTANPSGTEDRTATFQLKNGAAIYGGFLGGETSLNQRDWQAHETILSGDLNGNDVGFTNNGENSYHVVTGSGTEPNAVLDGFTVTAGNADVSSYPGNAGGGMYNYNSNATVTSCTFSSNSADYGGGMLSDGGSPTLTNCSFIGNSAIIDGGGMLNYDNSPMVTNCAFSGNLAGEDGGGMNNCSSSPTLTNCTFSGNAAADNGNALACGSEPQAPSNVELANCILWDGGNEIWNNDGSTITITYSDIQGGWPGLGNIDTDPSFVDPGHWDDNGTPADASDDFWVDGDYHLLAVSPCIDAGDNTAVPPDANDLDGDGNTTEPIPIDIDGQSRFIDDLNTADTGNGTPPIVDMGAYEFQGIIGDFCGANSDQPDGYVDYWDLLYFAQRWHTRPSDTNWDSRCDLDKEDNYVDYWDLLVFAQQWHKGVKP